MSSAQGRNTEARYSGRWVGFACQRVLWGRRRGGCGQRKLAAHRGGQLPPPPPRTANIPPQASRTARAPAHTHPQPPTHCRPPTHWCPHHTGTHTPTTLAHTYPHTHHTSTRTLEVAEGHLRLNHPELGEVAGGVRVLGAEGGACSGSSVSVCGVWGSGRGGRGAGGQAAAEVESE